MHNKKIIVPALAVLILLFIGGGVWLASRSGDASTEVERVMEEAALGTPVPIQMATPTPEPTQEPSEETVPESEEEIIQLTGAEELDEGYEVGAPREMTYNEILEIYKERAKEDSRYETVLENRKNIPESLLKHLANNPEMISFLETYPDGKSENCEVRDVEVAQDCPLFLQWDKRWGYDSYGNGSNIAISGCGPTSLAMVVVALTKEKVSPADVADYSMENHFYQKGFGTLWSLMSKGAEHYGLTSKTINWREDILKAYLDAGKMIIISVRPGDFTLFGHFMVIHGYDEEGFFINDPMCIYKSKQKWPYDQIKKQIKGAWGIGLPGQKAPDIDEPEETPVPDDTYEEQDPEGMETYPEEQTYVPTPAPVATPVPTPTPQPEATPVPTPVPEPTEAPAESPSGEPETPEQTPAPTENPTEPPATPSAPAESEPAE